MKFANKMYLIRAGGLVDDLLARVLVGLDLIAAGVRAVAALVGGRDIVAQGQRLHCLQHPAQLGAPDFA